MTDLTVILLDLQDAQDFNSTSELGFQLEF